MTYNVEIREREISVNVDMGHTILESAISQGVKFPHGCRSGNCGACKAVLHSGDVEMSPYSKFALTSEEKNRGLILACRSVPWSDCEISILDKSETIVHTTKLLEYKVVELIQATHDIKIIRMEITEACPFEFSAGQYVSLTFENLPPRDYSMANSPDSNILEFHIRILPEGNVTGYVQEKLKIGDIVKLQGPYGTAYLRENHKGPIIAIAGGSGLAPIKSIIERSLKVTPKRPIELYFGARSERDLYLEKMYTTLAESLETFKFIPVLSEPGGKTKYRTGFLNHAISEDLHDRNGSKAYIAGPPIMVESVLEELNKTGISRQDCHADAFYTEAEKKKMEV
ncbi:MAG: 2Fe-2S iron-sulfur cluster-binding protein [Pseudomonadota bacterium]|nr:2Fe-2S iron-sulfur cluster-binding protein [Pseudomonadota bacterium]